MIVLTRMTAKELKAIRKKLALSQSEMAQVLGISVRSLQGWEIGHRKQSPIADKWLRHSLAVYQDSLAKAGKKK